MLKILKKRIKGILPDKLLYTFYTLRLIPKYLKSVIVNNRKNYKKINFYTDKETVDEIINNGKSLSRFGDGEFIWMNGGTLNSYQNYSEKFSKDLRKAFQNKNEKLLIGIPYGIFNSKNCNLYAKMHWSIIKSDFYSRLEKFIDYDKKYSNASITRPYIDYSDYIYSTNAFKNLKRIWDKKEIIFVEGEKTKLGLGNDLFDNAKEIKRIICPAKNAYEKLMEIEKVIEKKVSKDKLIITALGPTASILASDMCDKGYQIIDIGHIDIEYSWYLNRSILRDEVPGKYVNESGKKECSDIYDDDKKYKNSIISRII
ncbi:GT-D fold domain-containing glycosyltransferase [Fusobacterium sp.]|uniref:GT-D fold domain-containing glycosyltransferase n=1 Tax=Fusobacterium sp. TaxID=68766 RepID=UPI001DAE27DB|nr:GT-D fold domain-containing glycosyltransferase [Fusobacterium sp.]MBS5789930.1 DUF1792 domain-containing protein [Fusobacterium sp.]